MSTEVRETVVQYLLGEMPKEAADRFTALIESDPALKEEVERLRPVIGGLEAQPPEAWGMPEPPALDMAAIVAADDPVADAGEADDAPAAPAASGRPRRRREPFRLFGFAWPQVAVGAVSAFALLAVGVVLGLQLGSDSDVSGTPGRTLALSGLGDAPSDASGEVILTGDTGDAVTLDVSGLRPTADGEYYELWLLGENSELVSLGSFRVDPEGSSSIEVPLPVDPDGYRYFDVSVEREDGDPGHSGDSVLRGLTRS
jgi:anti-sigma-K factor RskA